VANTNHLLQHWNQHSKRFEHRSKANDLIGERHETEGSQDSRRLVDFVVIGVLEPKSKKVRSERNPFHQVPRIPAITTEAKCICLQQSPF